VSKPVLGRNLGTLLKGETGRNVNPTLLQGQVTERPRSEPEQKVEQRASWPVWYWLAADLALVTLALIVVYRSPVPLSAGRQALAVIAVALGGVFAVWAAKLSEKK
jgi:hypothetical protein